MKEENVLKSVASKATPSPVMALHALNAVIDAVRDYRIVVEQERTKREVISAWKETQLADIQSKKELLTQVLNQTFQERASVIVTFETALDHGIATGDLALIERSLASIITVVTTNPMLGLDNFIAQRQHNPGFSIEL